jgi:hypothetical protein
METDKAELIHFAKNVALFVTLAGLIFAARLAPHAANFTPVIAVGLFAGVISRKSWMIFAPITGLLASNLFLSGQSFMSLLIVVAAALITFAVGKFISTKFAKTNKFSRKFALVFGATIFASVAFFLITNCNFLYGGSALYQMNFSGLMESYAAGLPFFRAQILGDLFYSGALFGAYEFAKYFVSRRVFAKTEA